MTILIDAPVDTASDTDSIEPTATVTMQDFLDVSERGGAPLTEEEAADFAEAANLSIAMTDHLSDETYRAFKGTIALVALTATGGDIMAATQRVSEMTEDRLIATGQAEDVDLHAALIEAIGVRMQMERSRMIPTR